MRKITFEIPKMRQIEINGQVFDILKADVDVIIKAAELQKKYANLDKKKFQKGNLDELVNAINSIIGFIDEILGQGAAGKITEGRPLGLVQAINLMTEICQEVINEYNEAVTEKYGD